MQPSEMLRLLALHHFSHQLYTSCVETYQTAFFVVYISSRTSGGGCRNHRNDLSLQLFLQQKHSKHVVPLGPQVFLSLLSEAGLSQALPLQKINKNTMTIAAGLHLILENTLVLVCSCSKTAVKSSFSSSPCQLAFEVITFVKASRSKSSQYCSAVTPLKEQYLERHFKTWRNCWRDFPGCCLCTARRCQANIIFSF